MGADGELWDAERVGKELDPKKPIAPASARKEMLRAGIKAIRIQGYPAELVRKYAAKRKGRGYRSDLHEGDV